MSNDKQTLILASASPRRLQLLQQIGLEPHELMPANIDETPARSEAPRTLAKRLSISKAEMIQRSVNRRHERGVADWGQTYVIAADTVVAVGRRILPKTEKLDEAADCLALLSGRTHSVYTSICLIGPNAQKRQKTVHTRVRFKRLSSAERKAYIATDEWRGKAGGYAIQGIAGSFVVKLVGSYSSVVGLPINETVGLLSSQGFDAYKKWAENDQTS